MNLQSLHWLNTLVTLVILKSLNRFLIKNQTVCFFWPSAENNKVVKTDKVMRKRGRGVGVRRGGGVGKLWVYSPEVGCLVSPSLRDISLSLSFRRSFVWMTRRSSARSLEFTEVKIFRRMSLWIPRISISENSVFSSENFSRICLHWLISVSSPSMTSKFWGTTWPRMTVPRNKTKNMALYSVYFKYRETNWKNRQILGPDQPLSKSKLRNVIAQLRTLS